MVTLMIFECRTIRNTNLGSCNIQQIHPRLCAAMGAAWFCPESGDWDAHTDINDSYVCSPDVDHDMSHPLSHYFISSGHNSYLTSDQLLGASGTSTIIMCLERGCRVIELDCYDGDTSDGPICKHGGTATKPVLFKTCIQAIRDHGFKASPYPVIITLENHTDVKNQVDLVNILRKELGSSLFVPPVPSSGKWLSPSELKGMFLIRTNLKKATEELRSVVYISNSSFKGFKAMSELPHVCSSSVDESKINKISGGLSRMATMMAAMGGRNSMDRNAGNVGNRSSMGRKSKSDRGDRDSGGARDSDTGEKRSASGHHIYHADSLQEVYMYTQKHLMRVYPAGWRMESGNYDPMRAWRLGASIVALNWQGSDKGIWTNEGMFRQNGGCGYIRKPQWMLEGAAENEDLPSPPARHLAVHVYSACYPQGRSCMCAKDDLLVQVEVKGMPMDNNKFKTQYIQDSGRLVVDKTFMFPTLFPELAVLIFVVKDHDVDKDDALGYFSLPLATLSPGKYKLPILNHDGKPAPNAWLKVGLEWQKGPAGEVEGCVPNPVAAP
ncbi:hypothetical protein CEUSTIGMA_g12255.t1 [Chlamydomonas eustigma]|uniref:Phosphoinositide phospholipase C n=1 Tax=Chlamydomonas eustigma TaxID=1157962 RepID=A0A250XP22_9CHLO|nr:hypothetical protein CEUSTIGMA_g12255.t1 [Chlamydomonas eustigma]|eukprot:GAX84834.1 hypothetical protein CEUSTIGMA_g12255.t1 [Chlamydomonas eustigma]